MATSDKPTQPTGEAKPDPKAAETGNAEVQSIVNDQLAKGYVGVVPDPNPNSAYALQSGPDSPPLAEDNQTRFAQAHAVVSKEQPNA